MYLKIKKVTMNSKETIKRGKVKVVWGKLFLSN